MNKIHFQCPLSYHFNKVIDYVCICQSCLAENKLICKNCLADHNEHIKELIQFENLCKGLTMLMKSNRNKIEEVLQLKKSIISNFSDMVEKYYQQTLKPFIEFDNMLRVFVNAGETYGIEDFKTMTTLLGENCQIDINKYQDTEEFILINQQFIDNTITKTAYYLNNFSKHFIQLNGNQVNNEVKQRVQQVSNQQIQLVPSNSQITNKITNSSNTSKVNKIISIKKIN